MLVILGSAPSANAIDFACYLSERARCRLIGFFFEHHQYKTVPAMQTVYGMPYVETIIASDLPDHTARQKSLLDNMQKFQDTCERKGIQATAKQIEIPVLEKIIAESQFADLIVADASVTTGAPSKELPSPFLKELLAGARCPVVIAPVAHRPVEEIVFCYDGSPSSIFSMKQFTYLFPEMSEARGTVVRVTKDGEMPQAEETRIKTWLTRHYDYSDITVLKGNAEDELFSYLVEKKFAMIVTGAYGRNMVSRFFRQSHADHLIQTLTYPIFITHY